MYNLPEIDESAGWLDAQVQRRLHMLLLLKTGQAESRGAAVRHLGVHRNTIANWLGLGGEGGPQKLCEIQEAGLDPGQQSIPPAATKALKRRLSEPEGFGSYKEIQRWLAEEQDGALCYSTVAIRPFIGSFDTIPGPR
jgi:hypothetical protein